SASTQRAPPSRRTPLRLNRGRLEHDPLTLVWKRSCWIVGVDLAREPVAVEGRFGDDPRSDAVADPVERGDPLRFEPGTILRELEIKRLVREPLGDEDDRVRLELQRLPELVRAAHSARADLQSDEAGALADTHVVKVLAEHR